MIEQTLLDTQQAFDSVAASYDRSNTENAILCAMRERVLAEVSRRVASRGRILDLGCGPGADDERLARAGYRVTAIDWSPHMVEEARARIAAAGLSGQVRLQHLGIHQLDRLPIGVFDAAYSNFGPLNCVPDLSAAATEIAARLRPGGVLIASVIGRVCPWELALYIVRGNWGRARVRFAADAGRSAVEWPDGLDAVLQAGRIRTTVCGRGFGSCFAARTWHLCAAAVPQRVCGAARPVHPDAASSRRLRGRMAGPSDVGGSFPHCPEKDMRMSLKFRIRNSEFRTSRLPSEFLILNSEFQA